MHTRFGFLCLKATVLAICLAVAPAAAQSGDVRQLMSRLDRIERDLVIIQRQLYRGDAPTAPGAAAAQPAAAGSGGAIAPTMAARLELRLSELEGMIQQLTGQLERNGFTLQGLGETVEKLSGDVEFRFQRLEGGGGAMAAAEPAAGDVTAQPPAAMAAATAMIVPAPQPAIAAMPASVVVPALPEGTPEEQYKHAFSLLRQADYAEAERALTAFLEAHPEHPRAANAHYWLGETYYARKDFTQAAVAFAKGYQRFPDGAKAQDNLLKLALSLGSLGKQPEACASLAQLATQFPDASPTIRRRAGVESERLGCR